MVLEFWFEKARFGMFNSEMFYKEGVLGPSEGWTIVVDVSHITLTDPGDDDKPTEDPTEVENRRLSTEN